MAGRAQAVFLPAAAPYPALTFALHVIALLAAYNKEWSIVPCFEHPVRQGVEVYVIDNESEDATHQARARR